MSEHDQAAWDERYRTTPSVWSGEPNLQLVVEAADLPPGRALDAGCGEGADALWLAGQGWHVTAVDFAETALARGRARADELRLGDRIRWQHADLRAWGPAEGSFELVTGHYLHLPGADRRPLFDRLAAGVAPGGTLLLVGHLLEESAAHGHGHGHELGMFFTAEELAASLLPEDWADVATETRERGASAIKRTGNPTPDTVLRARRRTSGAR